MFGNEPGYHQHYGDQPLPETPVATPASYPPSPVAQPVPMPYGGGGGGYSAPSHGGGYSPYLPPVAPSAPAPTLADSPTYQAFLRSLGLEESQSRTSTQDRVDALNRELNRSIPEIQQAGDYTRQGISGNLESRGLFRSGELEQALARQRGAEGQQISTMQGSTADQVGILQNDLARRIADIERRRSDATLQGAGQVYQLP